MSHPVSSASPARDAIVRVACPACRGVDTALYHRRSGKVSCRCGFQTDYSGFTAEVGRLTRQYLEEFPGLVDGSDFRAAVALTDQLLKRRIEPKLAASLVRAWNEVYASPPLARWQLEQAIELAAKRELARRKVNR